MNKKYADTLNLPKSKLPMKSDLPSYEKEVLQHWDQSYYDSVEESFKGRPAFNLLDGPPYANGKIHIGHAYNKILKDILIRSQALEGKRVGLLPGWDCHGLPIEKEVQSGDVEEEDLLKACRPYALKQVEGQVIDFKQLGLFANWNSAYKTMDFQLESEVMRIFGKLWSKGYVYGDMKPVPWCCECQSSLSNAEIDNSTEDEYSVYFKQEIINVSYLKKHLEEEMPEEKIYVIIWTTTPWTISENQAVAVGKDIEYVYFSNSLEGWIVSKNFADSCSFIPKGFKRMFSFKGSSLVDVSTLNPLNKRISTIYHGDFVSDKEIDTGVVHISPAHGEEDYKLAKKHNIDVHTRVQKNGCYSADHPLFPGNSIHSVEEQVFAKLKLNDAYVFSHKQPHSVSRCWRHKAKLFYLTTPQWFLHLKNRDLQKSLKRIACKDDLSLNAKCFQKVYDMISNRSEWCISRQRLWGVPIPIFLHNVTREIHPNTSQIIERAADFVANNGIEEFILLKDFSNLVEEADEYSWVHDTLDIWFDSGCIPIIMRGRLPGGKVDLVVEGHDQYRGWFQSSMILAAAYSDEKAYENLIGHGFTLDKRDRKMSKSLKNVVEPQDIIKKYGASVLRLYIASHNYYKDIKVADSILDLFASKYSKIRNTLRFLVASVDEVPISNLNLVELDQYIIAKVKDLEKSVRKHYSQYMVNKAFNEIYDFCIKDLSSFYIKHSKYRQYVSLATSDQYLSIKVTHRYILESLLRALMPIAPFLVHEVNACREGSRDIMQLRWDDLDNMQIEKMLSPTISIESWDNVRSILALSNVAFEEKISQEGKLQRSQCKLRLFYSKNLNLKGLEQHEDLARLFSVAAVDIVLVNEETSFEFTLDASLKKCERCWAMYRPEDDLAICTSCQRVLNNGDSHCSYI